MSTNDTQALATIPNTEWDGVAVIALRDRFGRIKAFTLVDAQDEEWARQYHWHASSGGHPSDPYARRTLKGRPRAQLLHRAILGLEPGDPMEGDHINGCGLDNRRVNLRRLPHHEGIRNRVGVPDTSSRFRGVSWNKSKGRWHAYLRHNTRLHHLGTFADESEAARAASAARSALWPQTNEARLPQAPSEGV